MVRLNEKDKANIILILDYGIRFGFSQDMSEKEKKEYEEALHSARKLYKNYGYKTNVIDFELESIKNNK